MPEAVPEHVPAFSHPCIEWTRKKAENLRDEIQTDGKASFYQEIPVSR